MKLLIYILLIVCFSSCEKTYICEVRGWHPSGQYASADKKIKAENKNEAEKECKKNEFGPYTANLK